MAAIRNLKSTNITHTASVLTQSVLKKFNNNNNINDTRKTFTTKHNYTCNTTHNTENAAV